MTTISSYPASKTDTLLKRLPAKLALGGAAVAIPIGYVAYKHISWMDSSQAKKRMAVRQATFWTGMAACLTLLHKGAFWQELPFTKIKVTGPMRTLTGFLAGILGAAAFKAGLAFSNKLYPHDKKPKPLETSQTPITPPNPLQSTTNILQNQNG